MTEFDVADRHQSSDAPASEANQMLAALRDAGAQRFDPARFRFIEAMQRKSLHQPGPVQRILNIKIVHALADYRTRFDHARRAAAATVARTADRYPDAASALQRQLEEGDLQGVSRRSARLAQQDHCKPLAELTRGLLSDEAAGDRDGLPDGLSAAPSFDALLREQEKAAIQPWPGDGAGASEASQRPFGELKAMRRFKDSWAKFSTDKRITQAIESAPENAGPLNSHMLVIRSLKKMRDISPEYLNRFSSYLETLMWLEQAGRKLEPTTDKMAAGKPQPKAKNSRSRSKK
jgi:hypothetical protein